MTDLINSEITLLCRVVDNYGDIGVVFRLAKAISKLLPSGGAGLRLIVDNLASFAQLSPGVDATKPVQQHKGWTVCQWDAAQEGRALYEQTPPLVIVECFACGRPEWLDDMLFDKRLQALRRKPVQIINLEYLTAEPYADEFHKLQSLTRSAQVRKVNFMPGFTDKTGGLILDAETDIFDDVPVLCDGTSKQSNSANTAGAGETAANAASADKPFTFLIFSYERDFSTIAASLAEFAQNAALTEGRKKIRILVAAGKSEEPFKSAWNVCADREPPNKTPTGKANSPTSGNTPLPEPETLPFLPQEKWDSLLYTADFLFIRGEDSLSRACLSGKPFVWHAYPQTEMYHLVKVQALLDRMKPFFSDENFRLISDYWLWYNGDKNFATNGTYDSRAALIEILSRYDEIRESFFALSKSLIKNGNLAEHLMTFISEIV